MRGSRVLASRQESEEEGRRKRIGRIHVLLVNLARQKRAAAGAASADSPEPGR